MTHDEALVSCILQDVILLDSIAIGPAEINDPLLREIWAFCADTYRHYGQHHWGFYTEHMREHNHNLFLRARSKLLELTDSIQRPDPKMGWEAAQMIIRERTVYNRIGKIVIERPPGDEAAAVISAVQKELDDLISLRLPDETRAVLNATYKSILTDAQPTHLLPTFYPDLDRLIVGVPKGQLTAIGGRPGMGKSTLGINMLWKWASKGLPVLDVSLEETQETKAERLLSSVSGVDYDAKIRRRSCSPEEKELIGGALERVIAAPYHIAELFGATPRQVCQVIAEAKRKWGIEAVVIDHLTKIREKRRQENRHQEVTNVLGQLLPCAAENDVAMILICQLSREVEHRKDRHPVLADLRETGSIEEDCRLVWLLYRDEYYHPLTEHHNEIELAVAKNNNGRDGIVTLYADLDRMKIECQQKEEKL